MRSCQFSDVRWSDSVIFLFVVLPESFSNLLWISEMGFLAVLREQAIIQKMKATASAVRKADTVMVQRGMVFFGLELLAATFTGSGRFLVST